MRLGMIFECGPDGADMKVCERLVQHLRPDAIIRSITLDNKPKLIAGCGAVAAMLLKEGCGNVIIVWDLYPAWRERVQRPCRAEDRRLIMDSLRTAGVGSCAHLVCIEQELEAWLLADGRAISSVLSTTAHPVRVKNVKNSESVNNPKKRLNELFKQNTGRPYNDIVHAEKIIRGLPDLNRIRRCSTFVRFAEKVTGNSFRG